MRQLPKAIPELDGGLFLPRPVVELLEAVLLERERALRGAIAPTGTRAGLHAAADAGVTADAHPQADLQANPGGNADADADAGDAALDLAVVTELRELLRLSGHRLSLPPAREMLGLSEPRAEAVSRNLLRE